MKTGGIILLVIGILNLLIAFMALANNATEAFASKLGGAGMFIVLGAFLIYRAKKRQEEENDKKNWENNNS